MPWKWNWQPEKSPNASDNWKMCSDRCAPDIVYSNLVADTHNGKFVYGNQLAGTLYLTADDAPEKTLKTYRVFDPGLPRKGDKALLEAHLDEYLLAFAPYFSKTIEQVTLDNKYINCLLRTGQPEKTKAIRIVHKNSSQNG